MISWTIEPLRTDAASLLQACDRMRRFSTGTRRESHPHIQRGRMGLGVGIFLIAIGAILTFAVNATSSSINVDAVGWILMAVGLLSVLLSLLFWQSWAGPGYWNRRRTTYVDEGPPTTY
jgi:H+/Cl- antiporter ClcA